MSTHFRIPHSHTATFLLVAMMTFCGCVARSRLADRLFDEGSFAAAERAYLESLETDRITAKRHERALYRLGLIYALPTSPRHDPQRAREYLERLLEQNPPSTFAVHASLVLALQVQTHELREALAREATRAESLERALDSLRDDAARVETEATDRLEQAQRLTTAISGLRQEIERLSNELKTREQELERIKQIDLEGPP
ncbi:MAG: hypothetical protein OES47_04905 [Acidobacteriota bacterium]|nr:hypothetical protein [Acidobacteriota bacterium]